MSTSVEALTSGADGHELDRLRRQIAAMSGRPDHRSVEMADRSAGVLAVPDALADLLPRRGLARGSVVVVSGARSILLSVIASVSGSGGQVGIVGLPQLNLGGVMELGGDLSRIATVPNPGVDPVEVAGVLLDGMDLVVLGLGGVAVPPSRTRVVMGRVRKQLSTLIIAGAGNGVSGPSVGGAGNGVSGPSVGGAGNGVSGPSVGGAGNGVSGPSRGGAGNGVSGPSVGGAIWPGAQLRLDAEVVTYRHLPGDAGAVDLATARAGYGRIGGMSLQVSVTDRGHRQVSGEIDVMTSGFGSERHVELVRSQQRAPLAVAN